jgi:hypothetical protein
VCRKLECSIGNQGGGTRINSCLCLQRTYILLGITHPKKSKTNALLETWAKSWGSTEEEVVTSHEGSRDDLFSCLGSTLSYLYKPNKITLVPA